VTVVCFKPEHSSSETEEKQEVPQQIFEPRLKTWVFQGRNMYGVGRGALPKPTLHVEWNFENGCEQNILSYI